MKGEGEARRPRRLQTIRRPVDEREMKKPLPRKVTASVLSGATHGRSSSLNPVQTRYKGSESAQYTQRGPARSRRASLAADGAPLQFEVGTLCYSDLARFSIQNLSGFRIDVRINGIILFGIEVDFLFLRILE